MLRDHLKAVGLASLLAGCGTANHPPKCNMLMGGSLTDEPSRLSEFDLVRYLRYVLEAAPLTADPRLQDEQAICDRLAGITVYTQPTESFGAAVHGQSIAVSGLTECNKRWLIIGTPPSHEWALSALTHELFHGMQACQARLPVDTGSDEDHANWRRDGILKAISEANGRND